MGLVELQEAIQNNVEFLRTADLLPAAEVQFLLSWGIGVHQTLFKGFELDMLRNLYLFGNTIAIVGGELAGISNGEGVGRLNSHLELLSVDFCHSLDFLECNHIAIFKAVPLVLVALHHTIYIVADCNDDCRPTLFSVFVVNNMLVSEINKSEPVKAQISGVYEAYILASASVVEVD